MAMLGVNGGLIGKRRRPSISAAPGVWMLNEQANDRRETNWPGLAASARYWRFGSPVFSDASFFEISEFQLLDGANVVLTSGITPTSSNAPAGGLMANLSDGSTNNNAYWSRATAVASGFWIQYDLGSPQAVISARFGSEATVARAPTGGVISFSANGTDWSLLPAFSGLTYSGARVLSNIVLVNN